LAGQIERTVLDRKAEGRKHIERAVALSGADPTAAFVAGEAAAIDGDVDTSLKYLRRAAQLDSGLRVDVADVYFRTLKRPELALEVAGDDLEALRLLVARLETIKTPEADALRGRAAEHAFQVLSRRAEEPDAPADLVARFAAELVRREKVEQAVPYYQRALRAEYGQTEWRVALAKAYEKLGREGEAAREVEACLRLRPQMADALELSARLKKKAEGAATQSGRARGTSR
jgi:tetratricopeptide (TPR) repeat protein